VYLLFKYNSSYILVRPIQFFKKKYWVTLMYST